MVQNENTTVSAYKPKDLYHFTIRQDVYLHLHQNLVSMTNNAIEALHFWNLNLNDRMTS